MAENKDLAKRIADWHGDSERALSAYQERWAKSIRLVKGVYDDEELRRSAVRHRSKIYFRKIWASIVRLKASFYNAFLRDKTNFTITGRDNAMDTQKAKILQYMTEMRRDILVSRHQLVLKFLNVFDDILTYGVAFGKLSWEFDEVAGIDGPKFVHYPPEQVFPDMTAEHKDDMRYIIFENFMTKAQMEALGYENISEAKPMDKPYSQVRSARHAVEGDPRQDPNANGYPEPGQHQEIIAENISEWYRVLECFFKEDGVVKYAVSDGDKVVFSKAKKSRYGTGYDNITIGSCLLESHKLIGEGLPEPLEGPQLSINTNLNMRKDAVALANSRPLIVNRFSNVDLNSLTRAGPGRVTLADDVNGVKAVDFHDATQSSYMEAGADEAMMQEMSGITPTHMGLGGNEKATVAQINLSEGNAKIDLYIATVAESFMTQFYAQLARMIQRFETDEVVIRAANNRFMATYGDVFGEDILEFPFEIDCTVNTGLGAVGTEQEIRQKMLLMDRGNVHNQQMLAMLQMGVAPPGGVRLVNNTTLLAEMYEKLGVKNTEEIFYSVAPPPATEGEGGGQDQSTAGATAPQIGGGAEANELQAGGLGGI